MKAYMQIDRIMASRGCRNRTVKVADRGSVIALTLILLGR